MGKYKVKELKTLSNFVKGKHKKLGRDLKNLKEINAMNGKI